MSETDKGAGNKRRSLALDLLRQSKLEVAITGLEREGGKRDPAGHYVALAYTYGDVRQWLHRHSIEPRTVKYISDPHDVRAIGWDLIVVCFPDWGERQLKDSRFRDAVTLVQDRIIAYRYVDTQEPVVYQGRIIGWRSKNQEQVARETRPSSL